MGYVYLLQKKILILSVEFDEVVIIDVLNLFLDFKCLIWIFFRINIDEFWVFDQFENCVYCFLKYDYIFCWV